MSNLPGRGGGFAARLRSVDMYRRIPKDLTESTLLGAVLSLISAVVIGTLFYLNLKSMFEVHYNSRIIIDHSENGVFQINFKIRFPDLSCEFAAVDSVDMIGDRRHDLSGSAVYKVPTGGQLVAVEHAAKTSTEAPVYGNSTNLDHYGNVRISMEVTADNFAKLLDTYDALLLNFHAPWCPHCQRFAPVWEHAAELTRDGIFGPSKKREYFLKLGMGAVDCTTQQNIPLCRDQHIQAFPTVRVYRQGKNPLDKHAPSGGPTRHYEAYVGERSAEAVSAFALKVLEEMEDGTQTGTRGTDANRDGRPDSKLHARGCVIQGAVQVARVPGELHFVPTSRGHSLNMANVNMTHVIEHLSFGNPVAEAQTRGKWWEARAKAKKIKGDIFPRDMGGKYAMQQERDPFVSAKEHITHDHYIKVVPTQYTQLGKPEPVELYEYTISSNAYALEPPFMTSGESHDGPIVKVSYDISPLQVAIDEYRKPAIEGILGMCSLLGGVYATSMILESLLQALHVGVQRHVLGKKNA